MPNDDDKKAPLTFDQAIARLDVQDHSVHVFSNPTGGVLVGAHWRESEVRKHLRANDSEEAGSTAQSMNHGVYSGGYFFATKPS